MPLAELETHVSDVLTKHKELQGYIQPSGAAVEIVPDQPHIAQKIRRELYRYPTKNHLYPGAQDALASLLFDSHDDVTIWTDDWLWRVATSSLSDLRYGLPQSDRKRFRVDTAEHKIPLLPSILERAWDEQASAVVVVDNNMNNLIQGAKEIDGHTLTLVHFVWKGEGRRYQLPWDVPIQYLPMLTIPQVTTENVQLVRNEVLQQEGNGKILWAFDFNETLLDTPAYEQDLRSQVVHLIHKAA